MIRKCHQWDWQNIGRRTRNGSRVCSIRNNETEEERRQRLEANKMRISQTRSTTAPEESIPATSGERRMTFRFDQTVDYAGDKSVDFITINKICQYCSALRFRLEPTGLCCANGKIKLPQPTSPTKQLNSLLSGEELLSKYFLQNTQNYNSVFHISSLVLI